MRQQQADIDEVSEVTLRWLRHTVPAAVLFLSGGQTDMRRVAQI